MTTSPDPTPRGDAGREVIQLRINGDPRAVPPGLSLEAVLHHCGYQPRLVVVEFNGDILPRGRWQEQAVVDGDSLEIVTIVGGGS